MTVRPKHTALGRGLLPGKEKKTIVITHTHNSSTPGG
jgi:hypothetical protein